MSTIIFTGRFQPLHMGHIHMLEAIKRKYPNNLLLLCMIRNTTGTKKAKGDSSFHQIAQKKHATTNNPLPNWNRYRLLSLAVQGNELLREHTEIIFRNRSDLDWDESVADLPDDRIWVFPRHGKEEFDKEKVEYYRSKGERVEIIDYFDDNPACSATAVREQIKKYGKNVDLSFLPESCKDYFRAECLKYFVDT